ncbi:polysaccharide biosynthesis tyrosine autokinase [Rubellimicrobium arenae]|uniref:polysaccharide biosynthesis tyrosine autokinase n=1 Tax=Rubellimicrobium arenae TaxID=2817372 RepID=UPI001B3112DC|nr:polysaccharide biosynthesis tyrosine autokinase [Rubellimicrobium arenae]
MQKSLQAVQFQPAVVDAEANDQVDLLEIVRTLWRGKHWIVLCSALAMSYGWYHAAVQSRPLYMSTTQMALQVADSQVMSLQSLVTGFSGDKASINTEMAVLRSGELLGRLVDRLHLEQDPEFNDRISDPLNQPGLLSRAKSAVRSALGISHPEPAASPEEVRQGVVDSVREAIDVNSSFDTYVFSISVTSRDAAKSALMADTLAELYRDDQIRAKVEATERAATWFSNRVGELRADLDSRQNQISDLRARSALVSAESLEALNAQAIELRSNLQEVRGQAERVAERLAALEAAQVSGDLQAKVEAAQDGQLDAAAADLASGMEGAQARFDRRFDQIVLQARAEQERGQKAAEDLQRSVDDLSKQFESQSSDFQELQQLDQDAQATQVLYDTFLQRLKETTAQESLHQPDSRILTKAALGLQVAPRVALSMAVWLVLGTILGAAVVLGREFVQNTFRTVDDLEQHTGRTVLGQIPRIPARTRQDTLNYLRHKPTSAASEAVRNLRTSILLSNVDNPPQVIVTTSSVPSEGKTTLAIALAHSMAGLGKRVLVIDGDIRRRTFDAYFTQDKSKGGLMAVISGKASLGDAVMRSEGFGVDVLSSGQRPAVNAADLFSSESFQRVVNQARDAYDYVIIDTPPVLVVPDARVIAQQADAVVYVVRWDKTVRGQVEEGLRQLRSVNIAVSGLVLSQIDPKGMRRYGYGDRYGAYSRYGRSYYNT